MTTPDIPVIRARLSYETIDEFIEGYARFILPGRMFLPMEREQLKPEGTTIRFEFLLADGTRAFLGQGTVQNVRGNESSHLEGPAGVVVEYTHLSPESKDVVQQVFERRHDRAASDNDSDVPPDREGESLSSDFRGAEVGSEPDSESAPSKGSAEQEAPIGTASEEVDEDDTREMSAELAEQAIAYYRSDDEDEERGLDVTSEVEETSETEEVSDSPESPVEGTDAAEEPEDAGRRPEGVETSESPVAVLEKAVPDEGADVTEASSESDSVDDRRETQDLGEDEGTRERMTTSPDSSPPARAEADEAIRETAAPENAHSDSVSDGPDERADDEPVGDEPAADEQTDRESDVSEGEDLSADEQLDDERDVESKREPASLEADTGGGEYVDSSEAESETSEDTSDWEESLEFGDADVAEASAPEASDALDPDAFQTEETPESKESDAEAPIESGSDVSSGRLETDEPPEPTSESKSEAGEEREREGTPKQIGETEGGLQIMAFDENESEEDDEDLPDLGFGDDEELDGMFDDVFEGPDEPFEPNDAESTEREASVAASQSPAEDPSEDADPETFAEPSDTSEPEPELETSRDEPIGTSGDGSEPEATPPPEANMTQSVKGDEAPESRTESTSDETESVGGEEDDRSTTGAEVAESEETNSEPPPESNARPASAPSSEAPESNLERTSGSEDSPSETVSTSEDIDTGKAPESERSIDYTPPDGAEQLDDVLDSLDTIDRDDEEDESEGAAPNDISLAFGSPTLESESSTLEENSESLDALAQQSLKSSGGGGSEDKGGDLLDEVLGEQTKAPPPEDYGVDVESMIPEPRRQRKETGDTADTTSKPEDREESPMASPAPEEDSKTETDPSTETASDDDSELTDDRDETTETISYHADNISETPDASDESDDGASEQPDERGSPDTSSEDDEEDEGGFFSGLFGGGN